MEKTSWETWGAELSKYGTKVLLTYGGGSIKKIGLYDKIVEEINPAGLELLGFEPLSETDLRGKRIIPFATNGGWLGHTFQGYQKTLF